MNLGPSTRYARDIVNDYRSKELTDPDYQREYVWTQKKANHFIARTISLGHVLGVITTYRLKGGNTSFLQDGRQRITTLMRAIDGPSEYGLCREQVESLRGAQVSQQSMVYETHDDARMDFQHLNDGVGLIPYEKYRGDLESDNAGRSLYQMVRTKVDDLSVGMAGISRSSEHGRKKAGQLHRHSLGLFYKYATRHKDLQLYAKSERSISDQIERRVRGWLDDNRDEWQSKCDGFIRAIESVNALLSEETKSFDAKRWDMTAVRAMYSAYLHIKSIGCPSDVFVELVRWFVASNVNRKTWSARYEIEVDGTPMLFRIDQVSLKWLFKCEAFGGPKIEQLKRSRRIVAQAGYDESHLVPHADGGTETFSEPAILNRSRGRRPVGE
jgi:hypothetical protein